MRIFNSATGSDTGGHLIAAKRAFARLAPDWRYDSMVASTNYIAYDQDVPWSQPKLEELYDAADVVHAHSTLHAHDWYDNGQGKPTILNHHSWWRGTYHEKVAAGRAIGALQIGSTLDLSVKEPEVEWVPLSIDLDKLRSIRSAHYRRSRTIRIGHAPTNRAIKGSDAFDAAIAVLIADGHKVKPVVIENMGQVDCLRMKAGIDIFFDQPTLGYGNNTSEAWAMGIPVVCGIADPVVREGMIARWGELPFMEASEASLEDVLRLLVEDADVRREYADRGTAFVERWHDGRYTVETLQRLYAAAGPTVPGGNEKRRRRATPVPPQTNGYEPRTYWQAVGADPSNRSHESQFVHSERYQRQEERLLDVLGGLQFGSVLEAGCGWGRITHLIHERWPESPYTAFDLSGLSATSASAKVPGVTFSEAMIQDFDPGGQKWDLVLASEVLMHIPPNEIAAAVEKLCSMSSGYVVTVDWSERLRGKKIAPHNFRHDYRHLYGRRLVKVERVGLQSIFVARASGPE